MTEDTGDVAIEHLRGIRSKLDSLERKIDDLTLRVGAIEGHVQSCTPDTCDSNLLRMSLVGRYRPIGYLDLLRNIDS